MSPDTELSYWEARARAVTRALEADDRIVLLGGMLSAPFNPPDGLLEDHAERIIWPPISELATAGLAVGAAMAGLRPLVPIGTSSFMFYAWPAIVNEAPNVRYLSGGRVTAPVVYHVMGGARRSSGVQHEHTPQSMLQNIPGLRVFTPATPADVDGLFHAALTGDDPVVIVDHVLLADARGVVPATPDATLPRADLLRTGGDVLIVGYSLMTQRALAAADVLESRGVDSSVCNLRTTSPLPVADVAALSRDHPAVVLLDESRRAGSPIAGLAATVAELHPGTRFRLVCSGDAPSPFSEELLDQVVPTVEHIVENTEELLRTL